MIIYDDLQNLELENVFERLIKFIKVAFNKCLKIITEKWPFLLYALHTQRTIYAKYI